MIAGLEDTDGRNVEEEMQLKTQNIKKNKKKTGLAKTHRHNRIGTASLPEDKEHSEAHVKQKNAHIDTVMKNLSFLKPVTMYLKPTLEEFLSQKYINKCIRKILLTRCNYQGLFARDHKMSTGTLRNT